MDPELKIYKASAGSGKTFLLAGEYLEKCLLYPGDYHYRHILAITFTRKSTAEMKRRILDELRALASGGDSAHLERLVVKSKGQMDEPAIREKAARVLKNILHDYSRFYIQTIDSFLQGLVRSFAREAGLSSGYSVEMDEAKVLEQVVHEMLLSLGDDPEFTGWMEDFSGGLADEGKSWDISDLLVSFLSRTRGEFFQTREQELLRSLEDHSRLKAFRGKLQEQIAIVEKQVISIGEEAENALRESGLNAKEDFKQLSRSHAAFLVSLKESGPVQPKESFIETVKQNDRDWAHPKSKQSPALIEEVVNEKLFPLATQYIYVWATEMPRMEAARAILQNLYQFGIVAVFLEKLKAYRDEEDVMLISDTSAFLHRIVNRNDQSFVFEKAGNLFRHFLADEFQDTSGLQWANLKPLVMNGISEGYDSLLVGDVKQAIYRFRNGDWNLLLHEVQEDPDIFGQQEYSLSHNWRSLEEIIRFNNALFRFLPPQFSEVYYSKIPLWLAGAKGPETYAAMISGAYENHEQSPGRPEKQQGGHITVKFICPEKDGPGFTELSLENLAEQVREILARGYRQKDLCILVRKNSQAVLISDYLTGLEEGFHVVSDLSSLLKYSPAVRFLISLMHAVQEPEQEIYLTEAAQEWEFYLQRTAEKIGTLPETGTIKTWLREKGPGLENTPLLGLVETLIRDFNLHRLPQASDYLQAFRNIAWEFGQASVSAFLEHWEKQKDLLSIDTPDAGDAIRVTTINKSKGLEFPVVLVPFCNFSTLLEGNQAEILWAGVNDPQLSDFPVLPVTYNSALGNSSFAGTYLKETASILLDKLNLMYVAFTRAARELHITAQTAKTESAAGQVGQLLYRAMQEMTGEEKELYTFGNPVPPENTTEKTTKGWQLEKHISEDFMTRAYIRRLSQNLFIELDTPSGQRISYGNFFHELLSALPDHTQSEKVLNQLILEGKIPEKNYADVKQQLEELWKNPQVRAWFEPGLVSLRERAILLPGSGIKIPDRVVKTGPQEVTVIEFKTGQHKPEHQKQLAGYLDIYRGWGYSARGALLYTDPIKIIEP